LIFVAENVTIYFLKDLISGKKSYVPNNSVQTLYVPQYKNLSLEKIFDYIGGVPQIKAYMPDEIDIPKIPKQWIVNVCASVVGQDFRNWVTE